MLFHYLKLLLEVSKMNKKEAIAYAQVALDYMQSSKYNGEITPVTLGIEMKQCFKLYPRNIIQNIANSQDWARNRIEKYKAGDNCAN